MASREELEALLRRVEDRLKQKEKFNREVFTIAHENTLDDEVMIALLRSLISQSPQER